MNEKKAAIPTQRSIAEAVGLSRETVSHILSGREMHRYNEETRQKVHAAAKKLGYRPNRAAQMMRKGRSNLIGVVHFGVGNHITRQIAHFLPQPINRNGYETLVVDLSWHGNSYRRALEHLVDARVEGVIISGLVESFGLEEVNVLVDRGVPTVMLGGSQSYGIPSIFGDSRTAFEQMVEHLHEQGHRDLLLIVNDYESIPTLNRIAGFEAGLRKFRSSGMVGRIERLSADRNAFTQGIPAYQYTKKLIASRNLPDAILCSNDQWAQSVFTAAFEAGLQIPRDLAVTGFDNEPFAAQIPYCLTTASPDVGEECEKAMEVLLELIAGRSLPRQQYIYPCQLIKRQSCGAPAQVGDR